jgi:hypothetical protein
MYVDADVSDGFGGQIYKIISKTIYRILKWGV